MSTATNYRRVICTSRSAGAPPSRRWTGSVTLCFRLHYLLLAAVSEGSALSKLFLYDSVCVSRQQTALRTRRLLTRPYIYFPIEPQCCELRTALRTAGYQTLATSMKLK
ncbi:unnamed protein product [Spodoptera exigua]|nr:unnamed protein product [Spodoptera exigua]